MQVHPSFYFKNVNRVALPLNINVCSHIEARNFLAELETMKCTDIPSWVFVSIDIVIFRIGTTAFEGQLFLSVVVPKYRVIVSLS